MLACTGPSSVRKVAVDWSKTWVPMMSDGSRSGVHCTRVKDPSTAEANVEAARVFASPGTDSSSTCPRASIATSRLVRRADCPTTRLLNAVDRAPSRSAAQLSSGLPSGGHVGTSASVRCVIVVS